MPESRITLTDPAAGGRRAGAESWRRRWAGLPLLQSSVSRAAATLFTAPAAPSAVAGRRCAEAGWAPCPLGAQSWGRSAEVGRTGCPEMDGTCWQQLVARLVCCFPRGLPDGCEIRAPLPFLPLHSQEPGIWRKWPAPARPEATLPMACALAMALGRAHTKKKT